MLRRERRGWVLGANEGVVHVCSFWSRGRAVGGRLMAARPT
jgi:hypothetical protein